MNRIAVPERDKQLYDPPFFLAILGIVYIYAEVVFIVLVHLVCWLHHVVVFTIFRIPKPRLRDFMIFDRGRLTKLTWMQRIGCVYCSYVNGVAAWVKATANATEIYACAIKHAITKRGMEHQERYYEYQDFQ